MTVGQSDCRCGYFSSKNCSRAICNAHISRTPPVRELRGLIENGSNWAIDMKAFLIELYIASDYSKSTINDLSPFIVRYDNICQTDNQELDRRSRTTTQKTYWTR